MTATRCIEEESGVYTGRRHPHNGYYAGSFSTRTRSDTEPRWPYAERRKPWGLGSWPQQEDEHDHW